MRRTSIASYGNSAMGKSNNMLRVVLDTNIIVSSIVYGGIPKQIVSLVIEENVTGITTRTLVAELLDVLSKKFRFSPRALTETEDFVQDVFLFVQPKTTISALVDDDDNRVLEAAIAGECHFIVTGDNELLELESYKSISIVTAKQFIDTI